MYSDIRVLMAQSYPVFGPLSVSMAGNSEMDDEALKEYKQKVDDESRQIKEGYKKVQVKMKEMRRGYKNAVDSGTRSGSGKLVIDNYDILKEIWGCSPSVTTIQGGITSHHEEIGADEIDEENGSGHHEGGGEEEIEDSLAEKGPDSIPE